MQSKALPTIVAAVTMLIAFFLPWATLFGQSASGYNLAQLGSYGNWAWVVPILAGLALLSALSGSATGALPTLSGLAPFVGLAYGLSRVGGNIFQVLGIGAHLTLVAAGAMLLISFGFIGSRSREDDSDSSPIQESAHAYRRCPFCAEMVRAEAKICRYCQKELSPIEVAPAEPILLGECPNCGTHIPTNSAECPNTKCKALFGPGSAWKVLPLESKRDAPT